MKTRLDKILKLIDAEITNNQCCEMDDIMGGFIESSDQHAQRIQKLCELRNVVIEMWEK